VLVQYFEHTASTTLRPAGPDARWGRDNVAPMDTGHTVDHVTPAGRLVTVFSAPDYPQFQEEPAAERYNNAASVLRLLPPTYAAYDVITYSAVPRPAATCFYEMVAPGSDDEMVAGEGDMIREEGSELSRGVCASAGGDACAQSKDAQLVMCETACAVAVAPGAVQAAQHEAALG